MEGYGRDIANERNLHFVSTNLLFSLFEALKSSAFESPNSEI